VEGLPVEREAGLQIGGTEQGGSVAHGAPARGCLRL
jgi:hypothetical protein